MHMAFPASADTSFLFGIASGSVLSVFVQPVPKTLDHGVRLAHAHTKSTNKNKTSLTESTSNDNAGGLVAEDFRTECVFLDQLKFLALSCCMYI